MVPPHLGGGLPGERQHETLPGADQERLARQLSSLAEASPRSTNRKADDAFRKRGRPAALVSRTILRLQQPSKQRPFRQGNSAMTALIALTAIGLFAAGVVAGIIGLVCVAIHREETNLTLVSEATDHVTRAGRWVNGVGVRAPLRLARRPRLSSPPAGQPGNQPVRSHLWADLGREWHEACCACEAGYPRRLKGGRLVAAAAWWARLGRRWSFAVREEGQMRYADAEGVRIAYDDEGAQADNAVVFLPGWCNSGRSFFALLADRLAARHRVIRLDWRGHGDSSRPSTDFSHDELADDAMAIIEATGVSSVVLVAQAHGGWPAIRLRRRLGDRVTKIVVLSWLVFDPPPPFMAVFEILQDPRRWQQGLDQLPAGWLAGAPEDVAGWVRQETGRYGFDMWSRAARAVTADYAEHGNPLRAAAELDHEPDMLHLFSQPRAGRFLAGQQEFSAANPWFSVSRLDGVTHFPALEIPDATAAEIERFIG